MFAGAGGAAVGYHRAGFDVVGVDIKPQPNYPFRFIQDDALEFLRSDLGADGFDAIHASPPCQAYSTATHATGDPSRHPDLIAPVRELLRASELPYVIENVVGAPLWEPTRLCGSWFGLELHRHRLFETTVPMMSTPCSHHWQRPQFPTAGLSRVRRGERGALSSVVANYGNTRYEGDYADRQRAMGIDWMTLHELREAIPPAYTELIGHQLMQHIKAQERARA